MGGTGTHIRPAKRILTGIKTIVSVMECIVTFSVGSFTVIAYFRCHLGIVVHMGSIVIVIGILWLP